MGWAGGGLAITLARGCCRPWLEEGEGPTKTTHSSLGGQAGQATHPQLHLAAELSSAIRRRREVQPLTGRPVLSGSRVTGPEPHLAPGEVPRGPKWCLSVLSPQVVMQLVS